MRFGPYGCFGNSQWLHRPPVAAHLFSSPSLRLHPSVRTGPPALSSLPHPTLCASFPPSLSLSLPSPMGRADISSSTKELVAGMEKQQRQLHSHGTKDRVACVHLQHRLPLSPARSLSNSLVSLIHIPAPFYHCFFLLVCLSGPTRIHGQSPRSGLPASLLTEGSQSRQYKHETISE